MQNNKTVKRNFKMLRQFRCAYYSLKSEKRLFILFGSREDSKEPRLPRLWKIP